MAAALLPTRCGILSTFLRSSTTATRWATARFDRACLTGIVFVLPQRYSLADVRRNLGCGSGMRAGGACAIWQLAGVWDLIHFALLDWLARDDQIDWSRAVVDSCSIRAVYGGDQTGPNPTDRAQARGASAI